MRLRHPSTALALVALLVLALVAPAGAEEPEDLPWTQLLPPLPAQHAETTETLCVEGDLRCVDATIRRMHARLQPMGNRCHHDAAFALYYLRTTEAFHAAVSEPGFFAEPAFLNHWATVFADYYFRAHDAFQRGDTAAVPPAWRIAFEAAEDRAVSGTGNVLLGMNAHITRDLPFVLANIGLRRPDGRSRKPDHDRVNVFLRQVVEPAREESARRLDPTMTNAAFQATSLVDTTTFQLVAAMREEAWRNAELLASAPRLLRGVVADRIEAEAAARAVALREESSYRWTGGGADERDAHCDEHWRS